MTEEQTIQAEAPASEEATEAPATEAAASDASSAESTTAASTDTGKDAAADSAAKPAAESPMPKKQTRKKSTAKKTRTVELTLTVTGTADGEWQADLLHAGKRVVQGLQIPASAVSKAAAELHSDISTTIEDVLNSARQEHEAKLAELEAEMERVRKALAELEA